MLFCCLLLCLYYCEHGLFDSAEILQLMLMFALLFIKHFSADILHSGA